MVNTIQAVAFDMDGLMFDTEAVYWKAADALLKRRGHAYTDELCLAVMGRPPRFCYELFKETFHLPESWQELKRESEELFLDFLGEGYVTMPGLSELLDMLETRQIPKGICTSSARRIVDEVLRRDGMAGRFDFVLTAEDIVHGKPQPEIYQKAAARFAVAPQNMLVLEDSEAGILAAKAAGAFGVAVLAKHNQGGNFDAAQRVAAALNDPVILALF